jgi:hypothetical protein
MLQATTKKTLVRITDRARWDRFVAASRQGSVFMESRFLDAAFEQCHWLLLEDEGEDVAGVALPFENDQMLHGLQSYCPYLSIALAGSREDAPPHRRSAWVPFITEVLLEQLAERYPRLSFGLHPQMSDLRGVQWFRHDAPLQNRVQLTLRYTGVIDLNAIEEWGVYLKGIRSNHARDARRAERLGYELKRGPYIDELVLLSAMAYERQGLDLDEGSRRRLNRVAASAIDHGYGEVIVCLIEDRPVSAGLFLFDQKGTYYIAAGTDAEHRKANSQTMILLDAISRAKNRGSAFFDMVGINSPKRGDYKTSFNAIPVPYFAAEWMGPPH